MRREAELEEKQKELMFAKYQSDKEMSEKQLGSDSFGYGDRDKILQEKERTLSLKEGSLSEREKRLQDRANELKEMENSVRSKASSIEFKSEHLAKIQNNLGELANQALGATEKIEKVSRSSLDLKKDPAFDSFVMQDFESFVAG